MTREEILSKYAKALKGKTQEEIEEIVAFLLEGEEKPLIVKNGKLVISNG